jgi:hypothetical protein
MPLLVRIVGGAFSPARSATTIRITSTFPDATIAEAEASAYNGRSNGSRLRTRDLIAG